MGRRATDHFLRLMAIGTVLIISAAGCSTTRPTLALDQARLNYMQAQQNPQIASNAPVALREAERALKQAEQAWKDDKGEDEVQHLAYIAERKTETARATAEQKMAEAG